MNLTEPSSFIVLPDGYDWKAPDVTRVFAQRAKRLQHIRQRPNELPALKLYYKTHIPQFISDWGVTVDPREVEVGRSAILPFILFQKQVDWLEFILARWRGREPGITEKSRDMGVTWLACALADSLSIFYRNLGIGFGSRKEEYVDKSGDPKSIFYKLRMFMMYLPPEFRGSWRINRDAPHMRMLFPDSGSVITGEAGKGIGRGDRKGIYFVDEAAHLEQPEAVDAALSNTTNCRQDLSSVNGHANPFAIKRHSGKIKVFTFHWRDDPRKGDVWYAKMCNELDPVIVAQEVDINYSASVEGVVIPNEWAQAAIDAHVKLKIQPTGSNEGAFDVADEGKDKCAYGHKHGILLDHAESWRGIGSDIYKSVERVFHLSDVHGSTTFWYDADGMGASVRGDAIRINKDRYEARPRLPAVIANAFWGSGEVMFPDKIVPGTQRTNADFFENFKAQAWWYLRARFQATFRALQGMLYNPSDIISISSAFAERARLVIELSQPVYLLSKSGKVMIDKVPEGLPSPNLADVVMMLFAPKRAALAISQATMQAFAAKK